MHLTGARAVQPAAQTGVDSERVRALIDRSLLWDNHGCMPLRWADDAYLHRLQRYRDSGFDVAVLNIGFGDVTVEDHLRNLAQFRHWIGARPAQYRLVRTVDDIHAARADGILAVSFDIEGANAIGDQLSLVQLYYDLGVRWMLMAYNLANRVGAGCMEAEDGGLTAFGRRLVDEMERVGMVVCCTHTGHRTASDVLSRATRPVIFSHSNARAVHDHARNIDDGLIRACAATGGVVGLNGIGFFLGGPEADLTEAFVAHVDHVVQLVGPAHVGLGFDHVFDVDELQGYLDENPTMFPPALHGTGFRQLSFEAVPAIVDRLLRIGYSEEDITAILGGNHMRIATEVWKSPI
jgi:membrane dipeptidase